MSNFLYLIGGANGAGKTTFALELAEAYALPYLGADLIAAALCPDDPWSARVPASREFLHRLKGYRERGESVIVESTLSGRSLARHVAAFREAGFVVDVKYIFLPSEDLHVSRVAARVKKGGHFVPEADVRRRFIRSARNFWELFRPLAHQWHLYKNPKTGFELVAEWLGSDIVVKNQQEFDAFMDQQKPDDTVNDSAKERYKTRAELEREIAFLRHSRECIIIGNRAIQKARAENTRLGVPNYSWIDGKVVAEP